MSSSFHRPGGSSRPPGAGSGWEATRVQTQIAPRLGAEAIDSNEGHDIGRAVGGDTRELFVSCEPGEALAQQLDHLRPEYVAVHDLGTTASRTLLGGIAAASQRPLQQLVIRRPGGGTTLATIEFVDCPAGNGRSVRLYSTAAQADTATRQALARVLLGRSRIGLVIVGDLPGHAIASALAPLREAVLRPGWSCRRLLFMPLTAGAALPPRSRAFALQRRSTRLRHRRRYLHDLSLLAGVVSVCAFDIASARPIGHAGARPGPEELARHGAALLAAVMNASRTLGLGASVPECSVTLGQHHLLVRALPAHPGMALHVVLDKPQATLALVQLQLRRLDDALLLGAANHRR